MKKLYDYAKTHEAEIKENLRKFIEETNGKDEDIAMLYDGTTRKEPFCFKGANVVFIHIAGVTYDLNDAEIDKLYVEYIQELKAAGTALDNGYVQISYKQFRTYDRDVASGLTALADDVQKGCTECLAGWYTISSCLDIISKECPVKGMSARAGIKFHMDPFGSLFPNEECKWDSTHVYGEFTQNGMRVWLERGLCHKDRKPEFWNHNEKQILEVLQAAGIDITDISKAIDYYKAGTGNKVRG